MKKIISYLIILLFFPSNAQDVIWKHKAGGKYADFLSDAIATLDYGFILAGSSLSDIDKTKDKGNYDYMLTKYTETGDKEWIKTFKGNKTDYLRQITLCFDSGYLLSGISNSDLEADKTVPKLGQFDIWLIKLDVTGQIEWQRVLGGMGQEEVSHVIRSNDGGYIIAGSSSSDAYKPADSTVTEQKLIAKNEKSFGNLDYWIVKINSEGNLEWQKTFGGKYKDILKQVIELDDGNILLAGNSNSPVSGNKTVELKEKNDWWIIKIDKDGAELWQKTFGDEADDQLTSSVYTREKTIVLGGHFTYIDPKTRKNKADIVLRKIDENGNLIWKETYDNDADDFLTNIIENEDGELMLGAYSTLHNGIKSAVEKKGKEDFLLIKAGIDGDEKWRRTEGSIKKEVLKKIIETRDGGYVLLGSSMPLNAKGDTDSDFLIVKIADKDKPLREKLPLEAVPNPAVNYTQAIIGKDYEEGQLDVYDLNGKRLYTQKLTGSRIVPVPVRRWADGVYIIHVQAGDISNSVKLLKGKGE